MEITWYGRTCVRMRGKDAVVLADPFPAVVGPTGRGVTAEIITFSHPDDAPPSKAKGRLSRDGRTVLPTSVEGAFVLDGPGEYEVRGRQTAFVIELDGLHTIHLGDIGHLLTQEKIGDIGSVDVACVPVGGALTATRAAELIAQLDPRIVVPMPVCDDERACEEALGTFFHEMGGTPGPPVARLAIIPSSLPTETTTVLLEARGKA
jgi:L-ascorbate metabolism protein UlaG (beta-lactamase superfamily)